MKFIWFNAKNKHFRIKAECQKYEKFYFKLLARKQRYFRNLKFSRYFRKRDGSFLILDTKALPLGIFILFYLSISGFLIARGLPRTHNTYYNKIEFKLRVLVSHIILYYTYVENLI